jgi:hypothetical protein
MTLSLTARDVELLRYLSAHKAAPIDVLAGRFFACDPKSGKANRDPTHAARRRLAALAAAGLVRSRTSRLATQGLTTTIAVAPKGARALGAAAPRPIPVKGADHHAATLRALERARAPLTAEGLKLVDYKLEFALRAEVQRGRATVRGEAFDAFPDAVLVVEDGAGRKVEVALEYVTSKYTDEQISEKAADFTRFARTLWVADTKTTAARVARLTGALCSCI